MENAGGAQYAKTVKSHVYNYLAVHDKPSQIQLLDFPAKVSLQEVLEPFYIILKDKHNNPCSTPVVPAVSIVSETVVLELGAVQWVVKDDAKQLAIRDVKLLPQDGFQFPAADADVGVSAQVCIDIGKGVQLSKELHCLVCPGE